MGLFSQNKFKYALMILLGLFVFLWYFSDALTPFIVGSVIAYLLDPLADRLEKLGIKRLFAVILICLLFLSILVFAVVFIFPIVFFKTFYQVCVWPPAGRSRAISSTNH